MTEAARSEGRKKHLDFRGLKLKLPAKAPGGLVFDIAEMEKGDRISPITDMIRTVTGDEQFAQIREKIAEDGVPLDDMVNVLTGLVNDILDKYGLTTGK